MRWFIIISFTVCFFKTSNAQRKGWRLYFSENVDSLYTVSKFILDTTGYFRYPSFTEFSRFYQSLNEDGSNEKINRHGIILNAKSTTSIYYTGEAIFGNAIDSVRIWYRMNVSIERNGRSALKSLINLISKEEDKSPQDEPSFTTSIPLKKGLIEFDGETILFSNDSLFRGSDNFIFQKIKKVKKIKTGKIKKANQFVSGSQLMKGDTCLAVLDYNTSPNTLYFLKSLSYKDRLIYTAFLTIKGLYIINHEEE